MLSNANDLLHKLGCQGGVADNTFKAFSEKYGFATPEEKEALAIAYSLWGGYIGEVDGVENRDGTIPGYGIKEEGTNPFVAAIQKILKLTIDFINKIADIIFRVFGR